MAEVHSWEELTTWSLVAARYNHKVFASLGPREGFLFSWFLQRLIFGYIAIYAKRHLRINH
jgi:hypothetical protein